MAAIAAAAALYVFEEKALILFGIAGVIWLILRNRT